MVLGKTASLILLTFYLIYCHIVDEVPWKDLPWHVVQMVFTTKEGFFCAVCDTMMFAICITALRLMNRMVCDV